MTFAERRAMWREKRHMRKFWRVRLAAALGAFALSIIVAFGGSMWLLAVSALLLGLMLIPFLRSDQRVETEWKALQAARQGDGEQE
jgi:fatty acid desaturase